MKSISENQFTNYQHITKTGIPKCITKTHSMWHTMARHHMLISSYKWHIMQ